MPMSKKVHPDLLIAASFHSRIIEEAKNSGLKVFVYNANTLDRAWAQMKTLGRITGHEVQAQNLVRKNLDNLAHVKAKLPGQR